MRKNFQNRNLTHSLLLVVDTQMSSNGEATGRAQLDLAERSLKLTESLQNMPYKQWRFHVRVNRTRIHVAKERHDTSHDEKSKCDKALIELLTALMKHAVQDVVDDDSEVSDDGEAEHAADDDDDMLA